MPRPPSEAGARTGARCFTVRLLAGVLPDQRIDASLRLLVTYTGVTRSGKSGKLRIRGGWRCMQAVAPCEKYPPEPQHDGFSSLRWGAHAIDTKRRTHGPSNVQPRRR